MVVQDFLLDLKPGKHPVHIHATQGDKGEDGWHFQARLRYDGEDYAAPSGTTAVIEGENQRFHVGFKIPATISTENGVSIVSFVLTDEATANYGKFLCKAVLRISASQYSTAAFVLDLDQAGVTPGAIPHYSGYDAEIQAAAQQAAEEAASAFDDHVQEAIAGYFGNISQSVNLIDTFSPIVTAQRTGQRLNVTVLDNKAYLRYRDNLPTYFTLNLAHPTQGGETVTLSFDVSGVGSAVPSLKATTIPDPDFLNDYEVYSDPLALENGRVSVTFTMPDEPTSLVRLMDDYSTQTRPTGTNIVLSNFQLELGEKATPYKDSAIAVHNLLADFPTMATVYNSDVGWHCGKIANKYVTATIMMVADEEEPVANPPTGLCYTPSHYIRTPYPMKQVNPVASCDRAGMYVSSFAGRYGAAGVGLRYRVYAPANPSTITAYIRLLMSGEIATPPDAPSVAYDSTIGEAIVDIAESYVESQENGRMFKYGANFFYQNRETINDENGYGKMECDTFTGLCLRGVDYDMSPYSTLTANYDYAYADMMSNTASLVPSWATALRTLIQSDDAVNYLHRPLKTDILYAADYAWMFWSKKGLIFGNIENAMPGDVVFFNSPKKTAWGGITHCAIMGANNTIYEVSGVIETGGRIVQHVSLADRSQVPCYFARPYGWDGSGDDPQPDEEIINPS